MRRELGPLVNWNGLVLPPALSDVTVDATLDAALKEVHLKIRDFNPATQTKPVGFEIYAVPSGSLILNSGDAYFTSAYPRGGKAVDDPAIEYVIPIPLPTQAATLATVIVYPDPA